MDSRYSQGQGVQMLQKHTLSFLPTPSYTPKPPPSEATEILDTDFEVEASDDENASSPRQSVNSLGGSSATTLSMPDELPTPDPTNHQTFQLQLDEKPVEGPTGPHLFRTSLDSSTFTKSQEVDFCFAMSPTTAHFAIQDRTEPKSMAETVKGIHDLTLETSHLDENQVRTWSPMQVAEWMYASGFDDSIVDRFIQNDISGPVLLDLQIDDLKELDIQSFGKRHRVMSSIQSLRNSVSGSVESRRQSDREHGQSKNDCVSPASTEGDALSPGTRRRKGRGHRTRDPVISPAESVSIVAIEQLLPKPHKCSKGENCSKYQKYKRKLERLAKEFPNEFIQAGGSSAIIGDPGNPQTAQNLLRPKSDAEPSVVASSDVLGPHQVPPFQLSEENLNEVQPRDPQESIRQFLSFQHVPPALPQRESEPALEMFPPLSPPKAHQPPHTAANLRTLPKLVIPDSDTDTDFSADRAVTPQDIGSPTVTQENNPHWNPTAYRQETPFSEMDVPITAIPLGPVARETSQSVPPNMRFGDQLHLPMQQPGSRSMSARPEAQRLRPGFPTMARLDEERDLRPIETPEDLTPRQHSYKSSQLSGGTLSADPDVTRSGWMRKRRTTRLLRHEWQDAHFTLKGTTLAMHKDERDAYRNSQALERIDVDDYAVACSSLASSSKLTAAFKRSLLKRTATSGSGNERYMGGSSVDDAAFAFSLVPANENGERRAFFASNGKTHHFAVKTRDERIDWMRELMLAKALKRGKENGGEVRMNGNVI